MASNAGSEVLRWKLAFAVACVLLLFAFLHRVPRRDAEWDSESEAKSPSPAAPVQPKAAPCPTPKEPLEEPPTTIAAAPPPTVQRQPKWRSTALEDLAILPSKFDCTDAPSIKQVCFFSNILMHRGDLWYIVEDEEAAEELGIPEPLIFEVGNSPSNDLSLPQMLRVTTAEEAAQKLKKAAKGEALDVAEFKTAILQRTRTFNNWFWAINGAGNAYHRLCKYMETCSGSEIASAALLQPLIQSSQNLSDVGWIGLPNHHAQAAKDLMSCFGPLFWVNHASMREVDGRPKDQLVVMRSMLVGIGDDVIQPYAAKAADGSIRYPQASPAMGRKRVQFIRQCAGLTPEPTSHSRPSILLVNRPYADGRTILNLDDVSDRLRRALPPDVNIRIFFPRGTAGIRDQAEAFDAATVVMAPHGAATANFNFLPHDAVALGVFALSGRWGHDESVGASMPAPPYNITVLKVDCTESTEARAVATGQLEAFKNLPAEDQVALLLGSEMVGGRSKQVKSLLGMSLLDWMDYRSYMPDPVKLTEQVMHAVRMWEEKVEARRQRHRDRGAP